MRFARPDTETVVRLVTISSAGRVVYAGWHQTRDGGVVTAEALRPEIRWAIEVHGLPVKIRVHGA